MTSFTLAAASKLSFNSVSQSVFLHTPTKLSEVGRETNVDNWVAYFSVIYSILLLLRFTSCYIDSPRINFSVVISVLFVSFRFFSCYFAPFAHPQSCPKSGEKRMWITDSPFLVLLIVSSYYFVSLRATLNPFVLIFQFSYIFRFSSSYIISSRVTSPCLVLLFLFFSCYLGSSRSTSVHLAFPHSALSRRATA